MASICGWKSPVPGTTHSCLRRTPIAYFCCDSFCRAKAAPACERGMASAQTEGRSWQEPGPHCQEPPTGHRPSFPVPGGASASFPRGHSSKGGTGGHVGSCLGLRPLQVVGAWALGPDQWGQAEVWGLRHRHPHPALGPTKAQARGFPEWWGLAGSRSCTQCWWRLSMGSASRKLWSRSGNAIPTRFWRAVAPDGFGSVTFRVGVSYRGPPCPVPEEGG